MLFNTSIRANPFVKSIWSAFFKLAQSMIWTAFCFWMMNATAKVSAIDTRFVKNVVTAVSWHANEGTYDALDQTTLQSTIRRFITNA